MMSVSLHSLLFTLFITLIYLISISSKNVSAGHLSRTPHNLSCYTCNSLVDGDACRYLQLNNADTQIACKTNQMFCSVTLFQYSTDSSEYQFYSVQRKCEESCSDGCSTVGERVKLFLCKTCCSGFLCNFGNNAKKTAMSDDHYLFIITGFCVINCEGRRHIQISFNINPTEIIWGTGSSHATYSQMIESNKTECKNLIYLMLHTSILTLFIAK